MIEAMIRGKVLQCERVAFPSGDPYTRVRILTGKASVVGVNFVPGRFEGTLPMEGDEIELDVRIRSYVTSRNAPGLGVDATAVRQYDSATV